MAVIPDVFLDDVARRFALLGDPTRLRIVRAMHECGECTVGEIADAAGTSVANASQHLQRLTQGGIAGRRTRQQAEREERRRCRRSTMASWKPARWSVGKTALLAGG